jgi:hypothetical protein
LFWVINNFDKFSTILASSVCPAEMNNGFVALVTIILAKASSALPVELLSDLSEEVATHELAVG